MSIESAKAFHQRMSEDDAFRTPFESVSTKDERQQLIKNAGYDFTAEEWQAAMTEIQAADSNEELQEEELEVIAGGIHPAADYEVVFPDDNNEIEIIDWFK